VKWITTQHLKQWADTIGSRSALSQLISDLIRASASDISSIRFPTGDASRVTVFRDDDDGSLSYLNHAARSGRSFLSLLTLETKIGRSRSQILLASDSGSPRTSE
jgi:hypothetical protein